MKCDIKITHNVYPYSDGKPFRTKFINWIWMFLITIWALLKISFVNKFHSILVIANVYVKNYFPITPYFFDCIHKYRLKKKLVDHVLPRDESHVKHLMPNVTLSIRVYAWFFFNFFLVLPNEHIVAKQERRHIHYSNWLNRK